MKPSATRFSSPRIPVLVAILVPALLGRCTCAPEEPPPLTPAAVGTVVGEAFVEDPTQRSLAGAVVQVYGMSARAVTQEGKQFVLQPIPLGEHTILMSHQELGRSIRLKAKVEAPYQTVTLPAASTTLKGAASVSGTVSASGDSPVGAIAFLVGGNGQQQALVGDDGSFELHMLPPGAGATIAVAKNGFEVAVASVDLTEGANTLPSALALTPTTTGNLTLRGKVVLDGLTDQRGTVVLLDGGAQVASTDEQGVYQFTNLGPGLYSLRAQHPGYQSVELPQVAVTTSGAQGLVDMFMAPGSDAIDDDTTAEPLVVRLRNPLPGQTLQGGAPVVLAADVSGRIVDDSEVLWRVREAGDTGPGIALGTGFILNTSLPIVSQRTVMEIIVGVQVQGVVAVEDRVLVYVERLLQDVVQIDHRVGFGITPADVEEVLDSQGRVERVRYRIQEGQPIELSDPSGEFGARMVFESDTGFTYFGTARLGELPVGTHVFDVTLTDQSGLVAHATVEVIVSPLEFTVSILSPVENPASPYYAYAGLPVSATVSHGFQTHFPADSVRWDDTVGRPVGNGLAATIRSLPAGDGVIHVVVTDVAGNERTAEQAYRLEDVEFTAAFNAPAAGAVILASESLTVNVGYTHTYQPPVDPTTLQVTLHSNRQANLRPDGQSTASFGVNQDTVFSSLVPGVHTLTARIFDGSRYAQATRQITVQSSYVSAQLVEPARDIVLYDGVPVAFAVQVAASMGDTPLVSWYLDGVEFDPSWGGYGTDAASAARLRVDLGTFSSSTAPFDSARWTTPSTHTVQAFVRLSSVTGTCRNIPDQAHCLSVQVSQLPPLVDKGDQTLSAGMSETWSGSIRLTGRTVVDGGELIVQPGTTVVVQHDPESVNGSFGINRGIHFVRGRLTVGGTGDPVRFGIQPRTGGGVFDGIAIDGQNGDTAEAVVTVRNTVFVGTHIQTFTSPLVGANRSFVITDSTFEDEYVGLVAFCPTLARGLTFRRMSHSAGAAYFNSHGTCPTSATYSDFLFEDVYTGLYLTGDRPDRTFAVQRLTVDGFQSWGLHFPMDGGRLDVADSQFRNFTSTGSIAMYPASQDAAQTQLVSVTNSSFSDLQGYGVHLHGSVGTTDITLLGNRFERCGAAISNISYHHIVNLEAHLNSFVDNTDDLQSGRMGFVDATGNYMGDPAIRSSSYAAFNAVDPGQPVNLQRVEDALDNADWAIAAVDNMIAVDWLTPDDAPLAYIAQPRQTTPYRGDQCIPLRAEAPLSGIDPVTDCRWYRYTLGTDPLAGTQIYRDGNGCLDTGMYAIPDGIHGIALRCIDPVDTSRVSLLTTKILVDSTRWAGSISNPAETWSGTVIVDGDVIIPEGHTLTVAPGTVVQFRASDRLQARHFLPGSDSVFYGTRDKVDLVVMGTLDLQGAAGNRVTLEASHGVPVADSWGHIIGWHRGTVNLRHVDVESATMALWGAKITAEPQYAPVFNVSDARFAGLGEVVHEVCPVQFDRVDATNLRYLMQCSAFTDLVLRDVTVNNSINFASHSTTYYTYPEAVLGVLPMATFERFVLTEPPQPSYYGLHLAHRFDRVVVVDSVFAGQQTAIVTPGDLTVTGSEFRDFHAAMHVHSAPASVSVDSSVFLRGGRVLYTAGHATTGVFSNCLVRDVATPFEVTYAPLQVNGSQIENATRVITSPYGSNCGTRLSGINFTGNNLVATTEYLVSLAYTEATWCGYNYDWETFVVDLQGSYLNGLTDQASIEAMLFDPRTDASSSDTLVGLINYGNVQASPLSLTLPTPRP